jgi:hypothetical protein
LSLVAYFLRERQISVKAFSVRPKRLRSARQMICPGNKGRVIVRQPCALTNLHGRRFRRQIMRFDEHGSGG